MRNGSPMSEQEDLTALGEARACTQLAASGMVMKVAGDLGVGHGERPAAGDLLPRRQGQPPNGRPSTCQAKPSREPGPAPVAWILAAASLNHSSTGALPGPHPHWWGARLLFPVEIRMKRFEIAAMAALQDRAGCPGGFCMQPRKQMLPSTQEALVCRPAAVEQRIKRVLQQECWRRVDPAQSPSRGISNRMAVQACGSVPAIPSNSCSMA